MPAWSWPCCYYFWGRGGTAAAAERQPEAGSRTSSPKARKGGTRDVAAERESPVRQWRDRIPYTLLCVVLGLALGWLPKLVHGPIPEKFDYYFLNGSTIVL